MISWSRNVHRFIQMLHKECFWLKRFKQHSVDYDKVQWTVCQTTQSPKLYIYSLYNKGKQTENTNGLHLMQMFLHISSFSQIRWCEFKHKSDTKKQTNKKNTSRHVAHQRHSLSHTSEGFHSFHSVSNTVKPSARSERTAAFTLRSHLF